MIKAKIVQNIWLPVCLRVYLFACLSDKSAQTRNSSGDSIYFVITSSFFSIPVIPPLQTGRQTFRGKTGRLEGRKKNKNKVKKTHFPFRNEGKQKMPIVKKETTRTSIHYVYT